MPTRRACGEDHGGARADAFIGARGDNEVDLSGSARGEMIVEEEAREKAFEALLDRLDRAEIAPGFAGDDRELNVVYQKVMKGGGDGMWGTVTTDQIRKAEGVAALPRGVGAVRDSEVADGRARRRASRAHSRAHRDTEGIPAAVSGAHCGPAPA